MKPFRKTLAKNVVAWLLVFALLIPITAYTSLFVGADTAMNCDEAHNSAVQTFVISTEGETILEAEDGKHFWPADPNWTVGPYPGGVGSNGTGFVAGFYSNPGSYIEYPISVAKAGKYTLKVCYANGGGSSPVFGVYVDGILMDKSGYAPVGGWGDWGTKEIAIRLPDGEHSLTFVAEPGIVDAINVDYLSLTPVLLMNSDETHNSAVTTFVIDDEGETVLEAEDGKHYWPTDPNWTVGPYPGGVGSNGSGFVAGFTRNPESYVEYPVSVEKTGTYAVKVCYANGGAESPIFGIYVDNAQADEHGYAPVGGWGDWGTYEVELSLTAGNHIIRYVAEPGMNEAINLDYISFALASEMNCDEAHNSAVTTFTIAAEGESVLEAEDAKHFWPMVPNYTVGPYPGGVGSNGSGFVAGFTRNPGSYVEYPVEVEKTGKYTVKVCYANGGVVSPVFGIYVDGVKVDEHGYAPVGGWGDWGFYELELTVTAGEHTICFVAEPGMDEAINLDYISFILATDMNCDEAHNSAVTTFAIAAEGESVLEAEDAKHFWPMVPNYTVGPYPGGVGSNGNGFVAGFTRNPGSYVEYPVEVEKTGKYTVKVCYANGGVVSPVFGIYVDGDQVDEHAYAPVGGWGDWGAYEFELTIAAGAHTIRFVAEPGMDEAINLDYISFVLATDMNCDEAHNSAVTTFVIASDGETVLEAEDAKHFWPMVPNYTVGPYPGGIGSNGSGFVAGFTRNPGSYVEYPVNVLKTGKYTVKVCYANGGVVSPVFGIYVDGVQVDEHGYAPAGTWGDWGAYEFLLQIAEGEHTVRFVAEPGMDEAINLDYISFTFATDMNCDETHNSAVTTFEIAAEGETVLEAEDGKHFWPTVPNYVVGPFPGGVGSNGSGFVAGFTNNPGSYVEYPVNVAKTGKYTVKVCYANGGVVSPVFGIYVDGVQVNEHAYAPVGTWGDWGNYEFTLSITAGEHTIRFVAEPGMGEAINLDYLSFTFATDMNSDEEHNSAVTTFVITAEGETFLEAEDGKHFWPADPGSVIGPYPGGVGSNGTGFVAGFYSNPGAYIEYPINVETIGKYTVKVCYANGGGASPEFGIYIDSAQVNLHGYAPVGTWGDWGIYEFVLTVAAGEHTLRFVAEPGMVDAINVDYISFELESDMNYDEAHNGAVTTFVIEDEGENVLEAEDAKHFWPFVPNWTVGPYPGGVGSNGSGFVAGFTSNPGSCVEYPVNVEKTGKYTVKVCYANGGGASPVFGIYIDGVQVDVHGYAPVGGWGDWGTYELELTLTEGEHTIRFVAEPGITDAINLDYISFEFASEVIGPAGDFDGNGILTISDVTALLNVLALMTSPDLSYDLDGDGNVTIADVTKLLNILSTM